MNREPIFTDVELAVIRAVLWGLARAGFEPFEVVSEDECAAASGETAVIAALSEYGYGRVRFRGPQPGVWCYFHAGNGLDVLADCSLTAARVVYCHEVTGEVTR